MTLNILTTIIIFLFPLAFSPGPGNIFFAINGARFGYAKTVRANLGYHIATWIVTYTIGILFLAGLSTVPEYIKYIKYLGSLYIIYLSFILFRAGNITEKNTAKPAHFIDGVLLLILNPKAYIIIVLLFTQFMTDDPNINYFYILVVTTIFTLNNFVAFSIYTIAGDFLLMNFRNTSKARSLNKIFGSTLFFVAIWILIS